MSDVILASQFEFSRQHFPPNFTMWLLVLAFERSKHNNIVKEKKIGNSVVLNILVEFWFGISVHEAKVISFRPEVVILTLV